jgi:hypothetical protein
MVARDGRSTYLIAAFRQLDDDQQEEAGRRLLTAFADDRQVTLGGNPVANHEISKTIEDDLRRAELLAVPLIVVFSFFIFRGHDRDYPTVGGPAPRPAQFPAAFGVRGPLGQVAGGQPARTTSPARSACSRS